MSPSSHHHHHHQASQGQTKPLSSSRNNGAGSFPSQPIPAGFPLPDFTPQELVTTANELYRRMEDPNFKSDDAYWSSLPTHLRNFIKNALPLAGNSNAVGNGSGTLPGGVAAAGGQRAMFALAAQIVQSANAMSLSGQGGQSAHDMLADPAAMQGLMNSVFSAQEGGYLADAGHTAQSLGQQLGFLSHPDHPTQGGAGAGGGLDSHAYPVDEHDDGSEDSANHLPINNLSISANGAGQGGNGSGKKKKKKKKKGGQDAQEATATPPAVNGDGRGMVPPAAPRLAPVQQPAVPAAAVQQPRSYPPAQQPLPPTPAPPPTAMAPAAKAATAAPPPSSRAAGKQPMPYAPPPAATTNANGQQAPAASSQPPPPARSARSAGKAPVTASPHTHSHAGHNHPSSHSHAGAGSGGGGGAAKPAGASAAGPAGATSSKGKAAAPQAPAKIWQTSSAEERENIKRYWLELSQDQRQELVKLEKDAVLRKMKEQQRHSCGCAVCGRKRSAIEDELEVLYDSYYDELESYAAHQARAGSHQGEVPPPPGPGPFPGSVELDPSGHILRPDHLAPVKRPPAPPDDRHHHSKDPEESEVDDDEYDDDEYDDEEDDDLVDDEVASDAADNGDDEYDDRSRTRKSLPPRKSDRPALTNGEEGDFFSFGSSFTTVKGGILTVADDLLRNDGQKFLEMMEQLAERRMLREEAAIQAMEDDEYDDEEEPEDDEDLDDEEDDEEDDEDDDPVLTDSQRMEEGRRMFQIFAARMFEQRVLQAYREKVAQEKQLQFLRELEEEENAAEAREARKAKDAQKKKDKKRLQKEAKEREKAEREAAAALEAAAQKAKQEAAEREAARKREEERAKREAEKRSKLEEAQRKEEEKRKRLAEEREREAEVKRKQKEKEEKARAEKEAKEREKKEREEKERLTREAKEKSDREEKVRRAAEEEARKQSALKDKEEREQRERDAQAAAHAQAAARLASQNKAAAAKSAALAAQQPKASKNAQRQASSSAKASKQQQQQQASAAAAAPPPVPTTASTAGTAGQKSASGSSTTPTPASAAPVAASPLAANLSPEAPLSPARTMVNALPTPNIRAPVSGGRSSTGPISMGMPGMPPPGTLPQQVFGTTTGPPSNMQQAPYFNNGRIGGMPGQANGPMMSGMNPSGPFPSQAAPGTPVGNFANASGFGRPTPYGQMGGNLAPSSFGQSPISPNGGAGSRPSFNDAAAGFDSSSSTRAVGIGLPSSGKLANRMPESSFSAPSPIGANVPLRQASEGNTPITTSATPAGGDYRHSSRLVDPIGPVEPIGRPRPSMPEDDMLVSASTSRRSSPPPAVGKVLGSAALIDGDDDIILPSRRVSNTAALGSSWNAPGTAIGSGSGWNSSPFGVPASASSVTAGAAGGGGGGGGGGIWGGSSLTPSASVPGWSTSGGPFGAPSKFDSPPSKTAFDGALKSSPGAPGHSALGAIGGRSAFAAPGAPGHPFGAPGLYQQDQSGRHH